MPIGLERGFPEEHPSTGFTPGRKDVKIASESALENHTALKLHIRLKDDVEGLPYSVRNPLQLPTDSREGSIVSLSPMTRIFQWHTENLQSYFVGELLIAGPLIVANARF